MNRSLAHLAVAASCLFVSTSASAAVSAAAAPWIPSTFNTPHHLHSAVRLQDGRALVIGSYWSGSSVESYDPATNTWTALSDTPGDHSLGDRSVTLPDGRVLTIGIEYAEWYDPATDTWTDVGWLSYFAGRYTLDLLHNGDVLWAGGVMDFDTTKSSRRIDPLTMSVVSVAQLKAPRAAHTTTVLADGRVLAAGGWVWSDDEEKGLSVMDAEIYDPALGTWSWAAPMAFPHTNPASALLSDGRVLVTGGSGGENQAEIYDPQTNTWTTVAPMLTSHSHHTMTTLPSGRVLVVGGPSADAELYDPATNVWIALPSMAVTRNDHSATYLPGVGVLITGGTYDTVNGAELYPIGSTALGGSCVIREECVSGDCVSGTCVDNGGG